MKRLFSPYWLWVLFALPMAVLTLIHWAALDDWAGLVPALVQFSPVIALSVWRVMQSRSVQHA